VRPLAEVAEGTDYTVTSVYERDEKLLRFLQQAGIEPGGAVRVVQRNYDQTVAIETTAGHFTIGPAAAEKVRVKRSPGRSSRGDQ
jgi:DtxR family Mn-dependent transcriptional regulator